MQLPDGRRHAFAQFGAGTFAGAQTYLGPRVIISPTTMLPEAEHLRRLGVANPFATLSAHPDCLVSTVYHVAMNRLREMAPPRAAARFVRTGDRRGAQLLAAVWTRRCFRTRPQGSPYTLDEADPVA